MNLFCHNPSFNLSLTNSLHNYCFIRHQPSQTNHVSPMPPTLIIIRHAQALHNADSKYKDFQDPELSNLGQKQCIDLRNHLKKFLQIDNKEVGLIILSPMRRTLQTAVISLDWLIQKGTKVWVDARWQENSDKRCNTGSALSQLSAEFPQIDFSEVDPVYPDKTSAAGEEYFHTRTAILGRAQSALRDLYRRPEKYIVIVSHAGFLRTAVTGKTFGNGDYRVFEFEERVSEDEPYRLVEWESTRESGGMGLSLNSAEVQLGEGLPEVFVPLSN